MVTQTVHLFHNFPDTFSPILIALGPERPANGLSTCLPTLTNGPEATYVPRARHTSRKKSGVSSINPHPLV